MDQWWEAGESGSVVTSVLGFESQLYLTNCVTLSKLFIKLQSSHLQNGDDGDLVLIRQL